MVPLRFGFTLFKYLACLQKPYRTPRPSGYFYAMPVVTFIQCTHLHMIDLVPVILMKDTDRKTADDNSNSASRVELHEHLCERNETWSSVVGDFYGWL